MGAGIAKCIADVLRNDIVSVSASSWVVNYPAQFSSSADVPTHFYTSLKDIWVGGTAASTTNWSNQVVDTYGVGLSGTRTIDVIPTRILDQIDSPQEGFHSNVIGAEYAEVYILLKIPGQLSAQDVDRITNAEARIRRLIDFNYRTDIGKSPSFPSTDINIDPNTEIKAYWQGVVNPTTIDSKSVAVCYYCYYRRLLLK